MDRDLFVCTRTYLDLSSGYKYWYQTNTHLQLHFSISAIRCNQLSCRTPKHPLALLRSSREVIGVLLACYWYVALHLCHTCLDQRSFFEFKNRTSTHLDYACISIKLPFLSTNKRQAASSGSS